jgi:serine protease Do
MLREIATALKTRPSTVLVLAAAFSGLGLLIGTIAERNASSAKPAMMCSSEYADTLEQQPARPHESAENASRYTYLVRSTARYECPYFAPDGKLRRRRVEAIEHGTAFAYEQSGGETYLLTNEHVAAWPEVTDGRGRVDGVPEGCKRVDEKLRIVHDEHDDYEPGHIPLQRLAADPRLDAAVLKATQRLDVMPFRIGKSASLRQGNAVQVRGFPLGLIHAVNAGKVVNPYDLDLEQGWDHVDFVIDALLSEGNSGSPVMALNCKTGQFELVGMYHAGYKEASALNVVVGIDQLREFMAKKRRIPRAPSDSPVLAAAERQHLEEGLSETSLPLFEFGGLPVVAERVDDLLRYHVYSRSFPIDDRRLAVLEDRAAPGKFGDLGRLLVRGDGGWRDQAAGGLGEDDRDLMVRLGDALHRHMLRVLEYRHMLATQKGTADERHRGRELQKALDRHALAERELVSNFMDLVERLAPGREGAPVVGSLAADAGVPAAPPIRPERGTARP